jgi:hypothetical protein
MQVATNTLILFEPNSIKSACLPANAAEDFSIFHFHERLILPFDLPIN